MCMFAYICVYKYMCVYMYAKGIYMYNLYICIAYKVYIYVCVHVCVCATHLVKPN